MQLPGLTSLRLGNNCLDDAGMPWACLAALPALMHLDLDSNLLTMVGGMEGGGGETPALLPTDALPALTYLDLDNNLLAARVSGRGGRPRSFLLPLPPLPQIPGRVCMCLQLLQRLGQFAGHLPSQPYLVEGWVGPAVSLFEFGVPVALRFHSSPSPPTLSHRSLTLSSRACWKAHLAPPPLPRPTHTDP